MSVDLYMRIYKITTSKFNFIANIYCKYLLKENQVMFCSHQNISGASQQIRVFLNNLSRWAHFFKCKKKKKNTERNIKWLFTARPAYSSPQIILKLFKTKRCNTALLWISWNVLKVTELSPNFRHEGEINDFTSDILICYSRKSTVVSVRHDSDPTWVMTGSCH